MMILANISAFCYGTSPNKFFDYIAMGLPVVVNHSGWVSDLVIENRCGFAADPVDHKEFGKKLIELSKNPELCNEMGKNSRVLAESQFDRDKLAAKFEEFIINL